MKKIVIITLAALVLFGMTATAFAKPSRSSSSSSDEAEIDASLVVATAPASGFDTGIGVTVGAGKMFPQIDRNFQGRVELSYLSWSATEFGFDVTFTRVPLDLGARYFIPTSNADVKIYVQGMLELSFDKEETGVPFFGTVSASTTNLGVVPGAGIDYRINPNLSIVADVRAHLISGSYLTLQGGVAYHF